MLKANSDSPAYKSALRDAAEAHVDALLMAIAYPHAYPDTARARRLQVLDWLRPIAPRPNLPAGRKWIQSDQEAIDYRTGYAVGIVGCLMLAEVNREGN